MRFLLLLVLLVTLPCWSQEGRPLGYIQLLAGQLQLNENAIVVNYDGLDFEGTVDDLPYLGGAVQMPTKDQGFGYGWEGGGFMSWQADAIYYSALVGNSGGTFRIAVDNNFWSFETFIGLYASYKYADNFRMYVSGGPLFFFATADIEDFEYPAPVGSSNVVISNHGTKDSDFSLGWYARAGMEFKLTEQTWVGVSVRNMDVEANLADSIGKFAIDGNVYMITVTNRY